MSKMIIKDNILQVSINLDRDSEIIVPDNIVKIGKGAFSGDKYVTKVIIPPSVQVIEERAFANCVMLTEIIIPDSVEFVGIESFYGCKSLTKISCDLKKTTFADEVFSHCESLRELITPDGNARLFYIKTWNFFALTKYATELKGGYKVYSGRFGSDNFPTLTPPPWQPLLFFVTHQIGDKEYMWFGYKVEDAMNGVIFQEREKTIKAHFKKPITLDTEINETDFMLITGISQICIRHALKDKEHPETHKFKVRDLLDFLFEYYPMVGRRFAYVLEHQDKELNFVNPDKFMTFEEMTRK